MKKGHRFLKLFIALFLCLSMAGTATGGAPKGFLKPAENNLEKRQLQMRQYETTDDKQIIMAVAGVLQDLGFTLDKSESEIGLVSASKKADATDGGQVAGAVILDILFGTRTTALCDKVQAVKASVITKPSLDGGKTVVRVTFQRVVWNMNSQVSKVETVDDPEIYQKFFDSLSKAVFLEAQKI